MITKTSVGTQASFSSIFLLLILSFLSSLLPFSCLQAQTVGDVFGFPSTEPGYSLGVSACYAGRIGNRLVMAGGCNFPTPGKKVYYSGIYAAQIDRDVLSWRLVGWLPAPAAYGATVVSGDSLLFIGGCNGERSLRAVYSLHLSSDGMRADIRSVGHLPCTVDNMSAALADDVVCVFGGNQDGKPSKRMLSLRLGGQKAAWQTDDGAMSRPRVQPVCVAAEGKVYIWGGFDNTSADSAGCHVSTDGLCYDPASGEWTPLVAPRSQSGEQLTLSGGVAWAEDGVVFATGGVNKDIFLDAISGQYKKVKKEDYLFQPVRWYRFGDSLLRYDVDRGEWQHPVFSDSRLARAGAQVVPSPLGAYYIGGELKPAVRTPQICIISE